MSSTIIRVKRRLEDNPQDALVLMCKKIKIDTEEISPSLFVFRGTVNSQETVKVLDVVPKSDTKLKSATGVSDIIQKIRKQRKEASSKSRYEVVNCSRGLSENFENKDQYNVVDLKKLDDKEKDEEFAYDLYISAKEDFDISMMDHVVSIQDYDLVYGSFRDVDLHSQSSSGADDDDDSNDENNWRNDYPDSEHSSINEEDMIKAMQNVELGEDLSSDTDEDKIYSDLQNPFTQDAEKYGTAYAKYKARVLAEETDLNSKNLVHCSKYKHMDEESTDGYKEDSDDGFYYGQEQDTEHFKEQYKSRDSSSDEETPIN